MKSLPTASLFIILRRPTRIDETGIDRLSPPTRFNRGCYARKNAAGCFPPVRDGGGTGWGSKTKMRLLNLTQGSDNAQLKWVVIVSLLLAALAGLILPMIQPLSLAWIPILGVGILMFISALYYPGFYLLLGVLTNFLKIIYIPYLEFGKYGISPYMLFVFLALLGFLFQVLSGRRSLILPPGLPYLGIFFLGQTINFLWVEEIGITFGIFVRDALQWVVFFLVFQLFSKPHQLVKFFNMLYLQALIVVTWGIITGIQMNYLGINKNQLLFWNTLQKNEYATYLGFVLLLSIGAIICGRKYGDYPLMRFTRYMGVILILMIPMAWMFTYSRSGFLGILTSLFFLVVLDRKKEVSRLFLRWAFVILLVILIIFLTLDNDARDLAVNGILSIINPSNSRFESQRANITKRVQLLVSGLSIISKYPLSGVDYSQWLQYSPLESGVFDYQLGQRISVGVGVHNRLLSIAVQSGLITLFGYLVFQVKAIHTAYQFRKFSGGWKYTYTNILLASVIGFQVALLFLPDYLWEWTIMGLLMAFLYNLEKGKAWPESYRYKFKEYFVLA